MTSSFLIKSLHDSFIIPKQKKRNLKAGGTPCKSVPISFIFAGNQTFLVMEYRNLLNLFTTVTTLLILTSCRRKAPQINVVCEENDIGNSVVKWETKPALEGNVKVYASTSPEHCLEENPVAVAPIAHSHLTVITPNPAQRYYYTLVFDDRYRVKTATRNVNIPGIVNFRDLGGYPVYSERKQVRWGKIYRSGAVSNLSPWALAELKNIGIRTIIDLRTPEEAYTLCQLDKEFNVIHIPVHIGYTRSLLKQIESHQMNGEQVHQALKKMYRDIVTGCRQEFKQIISLLQDESNYPVLMHCAMGKGRIGVASALVLAALEVDEESIMDDYRLSNIFLDIEDLPQEGYDMPVSGQEALTGLYSARVNFLQAALNEINRLYGDIDTYLLHGLGLNKEEQKRLKSLLLETRIEK